MTGRRRYPVSDKPAVVRRGGPRPYVRGGIEYDTATCPVCGRQDVPLRKSSFRGHLFKHRRPALSVREPGKPAEVVDDGKQWCEFHGDPNNPPPMPDLRDAFDRLAEALGTDNDSAGITGWPIGLEVGERQPTKRDRLAQWWADQAQAEIAMVVDKAVEYGATDLRDIGMQIAEMGGRGPWEIDGADAVEIGIAFYVIGKVSRLAAAIKEGRRPSQDTWLDIGIYARMAQRVHQTGGWPGV